MIQFQQQQQQYQQLLDVMLKKSENASGPFSSDSIANSIGEIIYNPAGTTFPTYFRRHKEIFKEEYKNWKEEKV